MFSFPSIFHQQLIPWVQSGLEDRLIVAQSVMTKSGLPSGVTMTRRKLSGRRIIARDHRFYGDQRIYYARWTEMELHELDVPKLVCVLDGATDLWAGEHVVTCHPGHFMLYPPRIPLTFSNHQAKKQPDNTVSSCSVFGINLYRAGVHCMISHCTDGKISGDPIANCLIRHPQTVQSFKLFIEEVTSTQPDVIIGGHFLSALFLGIMREFEAGRHVGANLHRTKGASSTDSLQEIRDYVKAHLFEGLTITKVAHAMYMSPSKLTQYLRHIGGQTFLEMLTECRIEEGKFLLSDTDWSIAAIAQQLGLKSSTYFSAFFLRHTGISPGAYREKSRYVKK